jgi:hypothetical protein
MHKRHVSALVLSVLAAFFLLGPPAWSQDGSRQTQIAEKGDRRTVLLPLLSWVPSFVLLEENPLAGHEPTAMEGTAPSPLRLFQATVPRNDVGELHDPPPFDEICDENPDDPWCDRGGSPADLRPK